MKGETHRVILQIFVTFGRKQCHDMSGKSATMP